MSLFSFYASWKQQKTKDFVMFPGGIERDLSHQMVKLKIWIHGNKQTRKHIFKMCVKINNFEISFILLRKNMYEQNDNLPIRHLW